MATITVEIIDHKDHRPEACPTCGDWIFDEYGNLLIRVSRMPDERYSLLVAFHEQFEALACRQAGIDQYAVDAFDSTWVDTGKYAEQGDDPDAPYHLQHVQAGIAERLLAVALGVDWTEYEAAIEALFE